MSFLRSFLFVVWLYGSAAVVGLIGAPLAIFWRPAAWLVIKVWAHQSMFMLKVICGLSVEVRGREHIPHGAALIAAKHQAMVDTVLAPVLLDDVAMVLKKELLHLPVYGWYALWGKMIAVDREAHASALKALMRAARLRIAEKRQIVIYPEGTRQVPHAPPDYKPGIAALYKDLKVPCTPVATNTGLYWSARGFHIRPGKAVIEFLPPIPAGMSRENFMAELELRIESASNALMENAP